MLVNLDMARNFAIFTACVFVIRGVIQLGEMGRWGVKKTLSRKETEIHPLSWSIGSGEETRRVTEELPLIEELSYGHAAQTLTLTPSHPTGSSEDRPLSFNWS
ncbi:hypothetical protein D5R40_27910 [Okeania hirsuta]|uniref:Uncharacterized protein n=1 Tax=Okeania hirsuta TaxID=1458930 RepID=A0A3N6R7E0_9CYAN|nr:hypothetical protein D4Z78_06155 [Okeania hirsuta]RQH27410.1 hypothetical protein D5R40_27910 [Okeania hirsuta]